MKFLHCLLVLTCLLAACAAPPKAPTPTPFLAAGEFNIPMDDGTLISAVIHGKGQPLVILAYGAGMESWEPLTSEIVAQGHTVLNFDYRGMGKSDGKVGNLIGDMANILRYLREHGYPKIICAGRSMGGGACLLAAHAPGMAGLVLMDSVTPRDFYPTLKLRYNDLTYPKLVFVSKDEGLLESNQAFFDATIQPKQLFIYPGSSHNLLHTEYSDEIRQKILAFIKTVVSQDGVP